MDTLKTMKSTKLLALKSIRVYGIAMLCANWLHHYGMGNIAIATAGEQILIFRHLVTD